MKVFYVAFVLLLPVFITMGLCLRDHETLNVTDYEIYKCVANKGTELYKELAALVGPEPDWPPGDNVLVCIPDYHIKQLRNHEQAAIEYEVYLKKQINMWVNGLNDPRSSLRRENRGKEFVIVGHNRDRRFDPVAVDKGLVALTTIFAYSSWNRRTEGQCPPFSLKSPDHPEHRPEFVDATYTPYWRVLGDRYR